MTLIRQIITDQKICENQFNLRQLCLNNGDWMIKDIADKLTKRKEMT